MITVPLQPGANSFLTVFSPTDPAYAPSFVTTGVGYGTHPLTLNVSPSPVAAGQPVTLTTDYEWDTVQTFGRIRHSTEARSSADLMGNQGSSADDRRRWVPTYRTGQLSGFGTTRSAPAYVTVLPTAQSAPITVWNNSLTFLQRQTGAAAVATIDAPGVSTDQLSALIQLGRRLDVSRHRRGTGRASGGLRQPRLRGVHALHRLGAWKYPVSVFVTGPGGTVYSSFIPGAVSVTPVASSVSQTSL